MGSSPLELCENWGFLVREKEVARNLPLAAQSDPKRREKDRESSPETPTRHYTSFVTFVSDERDKPR
jgi:hypothetical protein